MENGNSDYKPTQAELRAFGRMNAGYDTFTPQPKQIKRKSSGKAELKCFLGKDAKGKEMYQHIMFGAVNLVTWKKKEMIKENPKLKNSLKIVYEYI